MLSNFAYSSQDLQPLIVGGAAIILAACSVFKLQPLSCGTEEYLVRAC